MVEGLTLYQAQLRSLRAALLHDSRDILYEGVCFRHLLRRGMEQW